jgi:tetratricopeptide (TPR) repeat protein
MRARSHTARLVVTAALVIAMRSPAHADDAGLARARAALDQSDYLAARDALSKTLAAGDSDRAALVEIYKMTGIVAGALGERDAATEAFERMLALDPKASLPAGTSPKIARPFAAAQAYFRKHERLAITVDTTASPPAVIVTTTSDPLAMIERVRAIARIDGGRDEANEQPADKVVTIELRAGKRIDVRVVALDAHGNRLLEVGTEDVPVVIVADAATKQPADVPRDRVTPAPAKPARQRSLIAKWWLWGGVAVAFAGTAGYFAYDARAATDELDRLNADSSNHQFTEAMDVEKRARRDVLFANIGFGVAGAAAIIATILFLTEPGDPPRERSITATPVPVQGGGAVVVEVPF